MQGMVFIPVFDLIAMVAICSIYFSKRFSLRKKRAVVALTFICAGMATIILLGSFGIGSIYFMAAAVFISLLYSSRIAYGSIIFNVLIYSGFACVIHFKLFNTPLLKHYDAAMWMANALNFLFLNVTVVLGIRNTMNGLETSIREEARLLEKLKIEIAENQQQHILVKESEEHYKSLFFLSPTPMWIFDPDTSGFLQVNDAAVQAYGYSEKEFLEMTVNELRSDNTVDNIQEILEEVLNTGNLFEETIRHLRKDKELFDVEVKYGSIPFRGKKVLLAIVRDITKQVRYTEAIQRQNANLKKIAYMQSHIIRAPLTRIMGLSDLIQQSMGEDKDKELFYYLDESVQELDTVIRDIVNHSGEIIP